MSGPPALISIEGLPPGTTVAALIALICERAKLRSNVFGKVEVAGRTATIAVKEARAAGRIERALSGTSFRGAALIVRRSGSGAGRRAAAGEGEDEGEDEDHYGRFARLLDLEREEEVARFAEGGRALAEGEREARGLAVTRLEAVDEEAGLAGRTLVTFARADGRPLPPEAPAVGDPVALGAAEKPPGAPSPRGVVARRAAERIAVAFDDEPPEWASGSRLRLDRLADDVTFRKLRGAVERVRHARKGERLLEIREICDGARPLRPPGPGGAQGLPADLNEAQREAVDFALAAPDLALIHGPPGTGKTTAVLALIEAAVSRGERVLACAPSNAAVDLLVEKLEERGLAPVRLGHPARLSTAALASSLDERVRTHDDARLARNLLSQAAALRRKLSKWTRAAPSPGERRALREEARALTDDARRLARGAIDRVLDAAPVVAATLTGAEGEPLGGRTFDLAVIDEAAQALEPACWIAIARARRVVLAGDHFQLPPTVLSLEAARLGLARTLFARLHERFGERAARMLTTQYRMHEAIQAFPSARFYGGRLEAAPRNRRHLLADLPGAARAEPWTTEPLVFYDTSGAGFEEEREAAAAGASVRNPGEADLVARIVREVLDAGVPARAIGVIAPYAAQVGALRDRLEPEVAAGLEIASADGFQGREREAIVISLTRSNPSGEIGFLADYRRANVALTRARRALFVVGDGSTLGRDEFYAALIERCERAGALRSSYELS